MKQSELILNLLHIRGWLSSSDLPASVSQWHVTMPGSKVLGSKGCATMPGYMIVLIQQMNELENKPGAV